MRVALILLFLISIFSCGVSSNANPPKNIPPPSARAAGPVSTSSVEIVKEYKHDKDAFTQGLVFHDGFLFESTGHYGHSTLRKVALDTGKVIKNHRISDQYFGEGMTILNGKVYQVTWKSSLGFVYNLEDFKLEREFRYGGEGWGLANDGKYLILSDGTHVIRFLDPETFEVAKSIIVRDEKGKSIDQLNELEYIDGEIWANIWQKNLIARLDPENGNLLGWIDLTALERREVKRNKDADVLNGIAYDQDSKRIFVTGKNWKTLFEIKVK